MKNINNHKTLLPIQAMTVNDKILFTHQHAIFASDLLLRISLQTTKHIISNVFGPNGMIYLVAQRNILNGTPEPNDQLGRNCYSYISWKLKDVLRVRNFDQRDVTKVMKEDLMIAKDCFKRYDSIRTENLKRKVA